jgi:hypothetical protein
MSTTPERPDSEDTDQDTTSLPAEQSHPGP